MCQAGQACQVPEKKESKFSEVKDAKNKYLSVCAIIWMLTLPVCSYLTMACVTATALEILFSMGSRRACGKGQYL